MKWRISFLLVLILGIASCARNDKPQVKSSAEPSRAGEQTNARNTGEVVSKREITLSQAAPAEQPRMIDARMSEQQKLLTLESPPILPEDFEIGPLTDLVSVDRDTLEMISASTRFLNALQEGRVEEEALHAEVRKELATSIRYYLDRDLIPMTYRIGAITTESDTGQAQKSSPQILHSAWMNLRLFGSPGVCAGELYLERSGGRWYVSDLQIDFEQMGRDYVREQEVYYPSTYGWGIQ